ncbi:MAG: L-threonylcarbamoyladenylate synthase [Alphaproteobacteria bacterium]
MEHRTCSVWPATPSTLKQAEEAFLRGEVIGVPTETVYGLAARGDDNHAVAHIFQLKQRPSFNPLILHYPSAEAAAQDVEWNQAANLFAKAFWPGPLTLILPRKFPSRLSDLVSAGLSTVAVRVPSHPWMQALLKRLPFPLAAPSANRSGHLSPTTAQHVLGDLGDSLTLLVDGGASVLGIESTVLDLSGEALRLLREGGITQEQLESIWGSNIPTATDFKKGTAPSPGLLESHYAPRQPLRMDAKTVNADEGLLAFGATLCAGNPMVVENLSERGDLQEAAARLFACLHRLEQTSCQQIAAMSIPEEGLGRAINDRLRRAAAPRDSLNLIPKN